MENERPKEGKIIKDVRSFLRLKKELNYTVIKDVRNLFRLEKKPKQLKIEQKIKELKDIIKLDTWK